MDKLIDFEKNGYVLIRNVLDKEVLRYYRNKTKVLEEELNKNLVNKNINKKYYYNDCMVEQSLCSYKSKFSQSLLSHLKSLVEVIVNKELYPTYSYLRIYFNGATLLKHTDRSACEYSVSVCIYNDKEPWDFNVESNGVDVQLKLLEGDIVIYKGKEIPHWRNKYEGNEQIQFFLHYVDKNGKYADLKDDNKDDHRKTLNGDTN
jgi:hypothetical protein